MRNETLIKAIGKEMHEKRFKKLLITNQISSQLNIPESDIENIELGKFKGVNLVSFLDLCAFYDIDILMHATKLSSSVKEG